MHIKRRFDAAAIPGHVMLVPPVELQGFLAIELIQCNKRKPRREA